MLADTPEYRMEHIGTHLSFGNLPYTWATNEKYYWEGGFWTGAFPPGFYTIALDGSPVQPFAIMREAARLSSDRTWNVL